MNLFGNILSQFSTEDCDKVMSQLGLFGNLVVWEESGVTGVPPATIIYNAVWAVAEWQEVRQPAESFNMVDRCMAWHKPRLGFVKINVDISFFEVSLQTGARMIIQNAEGKSPAFRTLLCEIT